MHDLIKWTYLHLLLMTRSFLILMVRKLIHQKPAVILQQLCYGKISFAVLAPSVSVTFWYSSQAEAEVD